MANDRVKVIGYAERVLFNGGIEFRNFSDDLVGRQLTSNGGTPRFTLGNFNVTTNLRPKQDKVFKTNKFSKFFNLNDIKVAEDENEEILKKIKNPDINFDLSNLENFALFGSLEERIRVALENIITNWPASIYVDSEDPFVPNLTGETFRNYSYNSVTNTSHFTVDVDRFINKFKVNYLKSGKKLDDFSEVNSIRNVTSNFSKYSILVDGKEFPVVGYTGATKPENDFIQLQVRGNVFGNRPNDTNYHIKPNKQEVEKFFSNLGDLESYLLSRDVTPKYTSVFKVKEELDTGALVNRRRRLTWPVSDGYNIDFDTTRYTRYVSDLIDIAQTYDDNQGDLMVRRLTTDSLTEFDSVSTDLSLDKEEFAGQKVTKTLRIYGREFDEIRKKIYGISLANTVTYDKKDNTADSLLKNLARVMGWDPISSVVENDLLNAFLDTKESSYSGHSRGYTSYEAEVELWRRIILNTPWLWKSKGTRKAVEFLLRFIGTPKGLITLNEYVYVAKEKQNMELFLDILEKNTGTRDINNLNVDIEGYPKTLPDDSNMYFQKAGLWYRETGGANPDVDKLKGNNPHVGPYDGGFEYVNQFSCLIPDFESTTLIEENTKTSDIDIFSNYESGDINSPQYTVYAKVMNLENVELTDCPTLSGSVIMDPKPEENLDECGCEDARTDYAIKMDISKKQKIQDNEVIEDYNDCDIESFSLSGNGWVIFNIGGQANDTEFIDRECCEALGYQPILCVGDNRYRCFWKEDLSEVPCTTQAAGGGGGGPIDV